MEGAVNVGENDQGLNRPQKEKGPERANRLRGILNSGRPGKPARTRMFAKNSKRSKRETRKQFIGLGEKCSCCNSQ